MADSIDFSLIGVEELNAKLNEVVYDTKRKGGRSALRKAALLIQEKAMAGAEKIDDPKSTERIADNIVTRWSGKRFKRTGDLMFRVGVLGGARKDSKKGRGKENPGGTTWHWRLVEFGTEKTRARPFMRPALSDNIGEATSIFLTQYEKSIDRAIKRARKGALKK